MAKIEVDVYNTMRMLMRRREMKVKLPITGNVGGGGGSSLETPVIQGTTTIGSELSIQSYPDGTTYQWNLDGAPISGATNSTYSVLSTDASHTITVDVTYNSITVTSDGVVIDSNNAYVQAVIDKFITDGVTIPNVTAIRGYNAFFDYLGVNDPTALSLLEMVKIGALFDGNGFEASKYNLKDPTLNKSTCPAGDVVFGTLGWSSNGTTYINDNITTKRRANIHLDSSSGAVTSSFVNSDVLQAACGASSGVNYILHPYSGNGLHYYTSSGTLVSGTQTGFLAATTEGNTTGTPNTRPRFYQNGIFGNASLSLTAFTNDVDIFTCARNNGSGVAVGLYSIAPVMMRFEGYGMTDAQLQSIESAWNAYKAIVFPSFVASDTLTSDGKEVFLICGDSKTGTSDAVGQYALPNTVLQHNRTADTIVEVLGADVLNKPAIGSPWPKFGRLYNEGTGKKVVISFYGISGSAALNDFKNASWDITDSGTVYASAKTAWDASLAKVGVTKPKAIVIILGINDMNEPALIADTQTQMDNIIAQLNSDYGSPDIYISLPSVLDVGSLNATQQSRLSAIRSKWQSIISTNSNVFLFQDEATDVFDNPSNTNDGTHWNFAGNAVVAQNLFNSL